MLSFQRVTGPAMIETADRPIPMNDREFQPVVFGMAVHAGSARAVRPHQGRVQPPSLRQPLPNVAMAVQAFEFWRTLARVVAIDTMSGPAQGTVCLRERPGRYLSRDIAGAEQRRAQYRSRVSGKSGLRYQDSHGFVIECGQIEKDHFPEI
jgi:hypothetical protein